MNWMLSELSERSLASFSILSVIVLQSTSPNFGCWQVWLSGFSGISEKIMVLKSTYVWSKILHKIKKIHTFHRFHHDRFRHIGLDIVRAIQFGFFKIASNRRIGFASYIFNHVSDIQVRFLHLRSNRHIRIVRRIVVFDSFSHIHFVS